MAKVIASAAAKVLNLCRRRPFPLMLASMAAARRATSDATVTWHRLLRWRWHPRSFPKPRAHHLEPLLLMPAAVTDASSFAASILVTR